ncbi:MAG: PilZ domain-containing protein [Candidatus Omnitrophica bacterium]|nr:PilZ domain-containing protein [Candidatus Omnitrophota bacterium]
MVTARKEKRKALRLNTPDSVANCRLLSVESGGKFQFTVWPVKNISADGVAIVSEDKISAGALAFLNIDLDVIMKTVGVIAKVVWCKKRRNEERYEAGLNFSWWPKSGDKNLISDYISNRREYGTDDRKKSELDEGNDST